MCLWLCSWLVFTKPRGTQRAYRKVRPGSLDHPRQLLGWAELLNPCLLLSLVYGCHRARRAESQPHLVCLELGVWSRTVWPGGLCDSCSHCAIILWSLVMHFRNLWKHRPVFSSQSHIVCLLGGKGSFWLDAFLFSFFFLISDCTTYFLKKSSKGPYERKRDATAQRILQGTMLIVAQNYSEEVSLIQLTKCSEAKSQCLPLTKTFKLRQAPSDLQLLLLENHVFLERSLPELQKLWLIFSYKWHPIVLSTPWSTSVTKWAGETDKQLFLFTPCVPGCAS